MGNVLRSCAWLVALAAMAAATSAAEKEYPVRPVRMLTAETGGGSDIISRMLAAQLSVSFGQQVVVENRVGGIILSELAARATPDGYTMIVYSNALWLLPFMRTAITYDPLRDFAPVSLLVNTPSLLVVHPSLSVRSVGDLIALARAKPGDLSYASGPIGATPHLAGELFKALANVDILHVPFKGVGLALNDVMGGRVQIMFPTSGSATPHVRAGRLRALAVTSAQPSPLLPGLPSVASAGLQGYEVTTTFGLFVPSKTARALVSRLSREAGAAIRAGGTGEKLTNLGYEVVGSDPTQLDAAVRADMERFGKIIRERGIRAD